MGRLSKQEEIDVLREENAMLFNRIDELENLCESKDAAMKSILSDQLRNEHSSIAGQELASLREYYKKNR